MSPTTDVWSDPELRALIRDEPGLAAVADALSQADPRLVTARKRRRVRPARVLLVAAALAAAAALALVAPWSRSASGSLSDLALAAIGSQPVLHVVAEQRVGAQLVDLHSGEAKPVWQQEEIWYDAGRGLKRDLNRVGSKLFGDTLETPRGGYTPGGIVYDCTWIAAHPLQATKARVSCNASGDNGTTPRIVPRPKPNLDPGLAGFVDGYRQALQDGSAQPAGTGVVDGQPVDWLAFKTTEGRERLALDRKTHKPILLESDAGWTLRILSIETIPYAASDFSRPKPNELGRQPSGGSATDQQSLPLDAASIADAVPGALWAGLTLDGLPLARAERQALRTAFADRSPAETGIGLELGYGALGSQGRLDWSRPHVEIQQAPSRALGYASMWGFVRGDSPPPGQLYVEVINAHEQARGPDGKLLPPPAPLALGFMVIDGSYLTVQASSQELLLAAARRIELAGK